MLRFQLLTFCVILVAAFVPGKGANPVARAETVPEEQPPPVTVTAPQSGQPLGLERYLPHPKRPAVILTPGLFLSPHIFLQGPGGGLAQALHRQGFEVWLWNPWAQPAESLEALAAFSAEAVRTVTQHSPGPPAWIGLDFATLLGLQLPPDIRLSSLVGIGPRVHLAPCPRVLSLALQESVARDSTAPRSLLTPLWTWGELPPRLLDEVLLADLAPLPPGISRVLADACMEDDGPRGEASRIPAIPVAVFASPRDGLAPLENLLPWWDGLPPGLRALHVRRQPEAPGHLALLIGRDAPRSLYRPLARWLHHPRPESRRLRPMLGPATQEVP